MIEIVIYGNYVDVGYDVFLVCINVCFVVNVQQGVVKVFMIDVEGLWEFYFDVFVDLVECQYYNCYVCCQFIQCFGGFVVIDDLGCIMLVVWNEDDVDEYYKLFIIVMCKLVSCVKVVGLFMFSDKKWGMLVIGDWYYLLVMLFISMVYIGCMLIVGQVMVEKCEDFKIVMYVLNEFMQLMVEQVLMLLELDVLYCSEKVLGQVQWFYDLYVVKVVGYDKKNVVWCVIVLVLVGFCYLCSFMIGMLLEDIVVGKDFFEVFCSFVVKMYLLVYQCLQVVLKVGVIVQVEKLFEQLELVLVLECCIVCLDEVLKVWMLCVIELVKFVGGGIFGYFVFKGLQLLLVMEVFVFLMILQKFVQIVILGVEEIEV